PSMCASRDARSHSRCGAPGGAADGEIERHGRAHQRVAVMLRAQAHRFALELGQLTVVHGFLLWMIDEATLGLDNPFVKRIVLISTIRVAHRLGETPWPAPTSTSTSCAASPPWPTAAASPPRPSWWRARSRR